MSSRIKGSVGSAIEGRGTRGIDRVGAATAVRPVATAAADPADSVHITDSARQLLALQQAIAEVPDINAGRVEQLRSAIEQNTYSVDSGKIADRLLQLEGDLQGSQKTGKS